jgi:hypothetical protein
MKMKTESRGTRAILAPTTALLAMVALQSPAATQYVSQSSPNPKPPYSTPETAAHNIQDAVDVATNGDTVLVAAGDYPVANQITVTNAVLLQSAGGASQTFLTGFGSWCLAISNALAAADGFTLRPDKTAVGFLKGAVLVGGTIQNCNFTNFSVANPGGAIVMIGGTVSNAIVTYTRDGDGAAVYCSDSGVITDSQVLGIYSSFHGSAVVLANSRLQNSVISGVPFSSAQSSGVAVSAVSSSVVGCTISNNCSLGKGCGAYLQDSLMDRCLVTGNVGGGECLGGGGVFETNSMIRNSLIVSNRVLIYAAEPSCGAFGGGVYMQGGALVNCTIAGNSAQETSRGPGGGGGVFAQSGGITNCNIYFNSVDLDSSSNWLSTGPAIFDHCSVTPDPGGAGNITQDPQFADLADGNYHLASSSPCLGAGVVLAWMTGAQDLDGNPRTAGNAVDMGAYQTPPAQPRPLLSIRSSGTVLTLFWPSARTAGFVLEQSSDLGMPQGWTTNTATVSDDGTNKSVTLPATNSLQFFRLHLP